MTHWMPASHRIPYPPMLELRSVSTYSYCMLMMFLMSVKYTPQVIHIHVFFILVSQWTSPYYCTSNICVLHFNVCVQSASLLYENAEVLQIR